MTTPAPLGPVSREGELPATVRAQAELPATVRALGWTSFLTDLSSEAIYPLLPAFVKGLGGTAVDIGLLDGVANAVAAIVRLFAGSLSDRVGRRPLILVGYGLSAMIRPLMGLVATPLGAVLVRTADRFGKGIRSAPRDALVTDLAEPAIRGRAFGHIRGMDHAGAALGPLAAAAFLWAFPGCERTLFLLAILPGLATLAVIWRFVRDPPRSTVTNRPAPASLEGPQWWLLGCVAIWALGAASELFLLRRAEDLGVAPPFVPLVWFMIGAVKSLAAARSGPVVDRLAPRRALVAGWGVFAVAYAGLALATSPWAAVPCMLVIALAHGIAEPAERALVAALAPAGRQGSSFGWYALVQGMMALPAGLLAGWLWDSGPAGPGASLAVSAVLSAAAAALLAASGAGRAATAA
ncbi:MAG: MFS transporter [Planctomycetaceae bacterium]